VASKGNKNLIVIVFAFDGADITDAASTAQRNKTLIQNRLKAYELSFLNFKF
jgi:hypothetical protein